MVRESDKEKKDKKYQEKESTAPQPKVEAKKDNEQVLVKQPKEKIVVTPEYILDKTLNCLCFMIEYNKFLINDLPNVTTKFQYQIKGCTQLHKLMFQQENMNTNLMTFKSLYKKQIDEKSQKEMKCEANPEDIYKKIQFNFFDHCTKLLTNVTSISNNLKELTTQKCDETLLYYNYIVQAVKELNQQIEAINCCDQLQQYKKVRKDTNQNKDE